MESVISGDDALLERYLEGETILPEELERVFTQVLVNRTLVPILCCAAEQDKGVDAILDVLSAVCAVARVCQEANFHRGRHHGSYDSSGRTFRGASFQSDV